MNNNQAFVATLDRITPIEGADKIVSASVMLDGVPVSSVVVGVDTQPGNKVVYFDSNMALEDTTILKDYPDLARYLGKRGRVKTVKLRGTYSDGLCVEIEKFVKYDPNALDWPEGFAFTDIGNIHLCHKYQPPIKIQSAHGKKSKKGKRISRMVEGQFNFHIDTSHLERNIHKIQPEDVISITQKVHGTSAICGNCLVKKPMTLYNRIKGFLGLSQSQDTEYDYLYASRSVVKNGCMDTGYYSTNIWTEAGQIFKGKLAEGETVYYEIVGRQSNGGWIQKNYDYGCGPCEHKVYVYRITKTGMDGDVVEYGWPAVKERCRQLCVDHVPEYFFGSVQMLVPCEGDVKEWQNKLLEYLREKYLEKTLIGNRCKKVPDEGIVVRRETGGLDVYKFKSLAFKKAEIEAYEKDAENIEDTESSE